MRICVLGCGSIGLRHLRNLSAAGFHDLVGYDPDEARLKDVGQAVPARCVPTLDEVWQSRPDIAFITGPPSAHVHLALAAAERGCHLFIEKPLADTPVGLPQLLPMVTERRLITMVGCNMRFHPGPAKVKELIVRQMIGKLLFARIYAGSYLPAWRPGSDYRKSYSARRSLGGGCLLDCIHEIDLARWYLGEVEEVTCVAGRVSSLEIDTEDVAALICRHESGALSEIHLDYVQRAYDRGCRIAGEDGAISWDFVNGATRCYDAATGEWECYSEPAGYEINQMYVDELSHFLDCVRNERETCFPVGEACSVMQIVFAAKQSAECRRSVPIKGVL